VFEINFRIVDDLEYLSNIDTHQFDADGADIEGFFALNFGGNIEGYYHDNKLNEFEVGHELITLWFDLLIEVIVILEEKSKYVALKEIECVDSWLEFILNEDVLTVSFANYLGESNGSFIITVKRDDFNYPTWKEATISFSEFKDKVKMKANQYLSEIERINPALLNTKIMSKLYRQVQLI
jgi:hypothetical protein